MDIEFMIRNQSYVQGAGAGTWEQRGKIGWNVQHCELSQPATCEKKKRAIGTAPQGKEGKRRLTTYRRS